MLGTPPWNGWWNGGSPSPLGTASCCGYRTWSWNPLRVHAARVQVRCIERDQQHKLEAAVGPGQAALVVGHSMSGKTRLAVEVIKRKFPAALLLAAESGKAMRELFDGGWDPGSLVVWLDDLERFLGADGLTVGLLQSAHHWQSDRGRHNPGRATGEVLIGLGTSSATRVGGAPAVRPISLQRQSHRPELGRVRAAVDDEGVLAAVNHYGLGEYLGASPEALDQFEMARPSIRLAGRSRRPPIDWRRSGFTRPVSQQVLVKMLPIISPTDRTCRDQPGDR